nr:uracil-DNA glycosylase [Ornithinibacillus scapharcae]
MREFCPELWPELPTPNQYLNCKECGLYEQGTRMVWGEGTSNAPIMVVLDNPGGREDKEGNPIVCGTRQALQRAAFEAGIKKEQLLVTYILKRRPVRKYEKEKTRRICIQHLFEQLKDQKPEYIICLGNVAVQSFFGNESLDVKHLRGDWYQVNGFSVTCSYHPLATRRRPNLYPLLLDDFKLVAQQLNS